MNLDKLQTKLLQVARENPPSDRVPFAFEKRIMAHLAKPVIDVWAAWGRSLWRAAAACLVVMTLLGGWSFQSATNDLSDLSQDFEDTVLAALEEHPAINNYEENW